MVFSWKNGSHLSILLVGFALAFDFSVVAISIQSYWHIVAPYKSSLFGFVFGCYDLTQFLFMPVFGYLSDFVGIRVTILVALVFNIVGNIIYSFGLYTGTSTNDEDNGYALGTYQMLIVGRLIAGIGSSALGLGVVYLASVTTISERIGSIGIYRGSQTIARTVGPFITFALEGMSFELVTDSQLIFNFYTIPGWIAVFVSLMSFTVFFIFFENPDLPKLPATPFRYSQSKGLVFQSGVICTIHFIVTFALMSQLFGISAGQYHMISDASNIWICYIAVGISAGTTFHLWRRTITFFQDYTYVLASLNLASVCFLLLIDYGHDGNPPSQILYYIASVFLGASMVLFFANMESFYTKKVSQYASQAGRHFGFFIALQPAAGALGRFLGPVLFSAGINIQQTNPRTCNPQFSYNAAYSADSEATIYSMLKKCKLSEICLLQFPQVFLEEGCSLDNITAWMIVMAIAVLIVFIYMTFFYLPVHASHDQAKTKDRQLVNAPATDNMHQELLAEDSSYAAP